MRKSILAYIFLLAGFIGSVSGQNLEIVLDSTFTNLKIGQSFAVTGRVQNSGADIPSGQTIKATVEFVGPDGIAVASHVQTWNGFPEVNNPGTLRNDNTNSRVIFQFPWSQAGKAVSGWSIRAFVEGAALETDLSDNTAIHDGFIMDLPDLIVASSSLSTDNATNTFLPNSVITASGIVRNIGQARTQENILFPLVARLYRGNTAIPANLVETETLIIPSPDAGGFPYIEENDDLSYTINNIHLPSDALPGDAFTLTVTVDPSDLAFGDIIHEVSDIGGQQTSTNSFTISTAAVNRAQLTVDPDSFEGDVGSFRGLEPIRIAFTVRNNGQSPVQTTENFTLQVALSKNLTFDGSDFILREFDLGGDALGSNLLPNESITLDWIQQLPDNFEGDFYYLVSVQGTNTQTFFLENTPSITLGSTNGGTTELVDGVGNNNMERPDTSRDGKVVVYEQTDANGIQQVYFQRIGSGQAATLISRSSDQNVGNANSLRPKVSADGSVIVFFSKADNLVNFPTDDNGVEDIFVYDLKAAFLSRIVNLDTLEGGNGASLYPDVNEDGSVIVFESQATNLTESTLSSGRRIFYYQSAINGTPIITSLNETANNSSYSPSISDDGKKVVYASDASNLVSGDTNGQSDIFLFDIDKNATFFASLNKQNQLASGGASDQPVISGDGTTIAYRSKATNLVQEKGISLIEVKNGGVGYFGNPTLVVTDLNTTGSGAILEFETDAIDQYGQILPDSIRIVNHGENYTLPFISVIPDPSQPSPLEEAEIKAHLSHPLGEIYSISTADVLNESASSQRKYSTRLSENSDKIGGDQESREPSISINGNVVAFSTKASNFLDENVTRDDGEVFYNSPISAAEANAILSGGIGEIEVQNPGSGYQNGFLFINDISGNGSGAVASYQVDSLGRIASITMVTAGSGYDLDTTFISVDSPRGGSGFAGTATRYDQGARIHRIEMVENGSGYQSVTNSTQGKAGLITLDGDGTDQNADGKPDAKIDSDRIFINTTNGGGIFIEQIIDIELLSANSLLNTTLIFSDYQQTFTLNFAQASTSFYTIGIFGKTLSEITQEIINKLDDLWNNPSSSDRFQGPKISGFSTGGTSFIYAALTGRAESNNPTAVSISYQSNMLIGGSGFTRATPTIAPAPVVHGFSEVVSGTNVSTMTNGRSLYLPVVDTETDDIYLYTSTSGNLERISRSSFGLPVNYLPSSTSVMPSNRFPSLSGDGRHVFFSSDASGAGGLAFNRSNQLPAGNNNFRKLYYRDRKTIPEVKTPATSPTLGISTLTFSTSASAISQTPAIYPLGDGQELILPFDTSSGYTLFLDTMGLILSDGSSSVQISDSNGTPLSGWSFTGTGNGTQIDTLTIQYDDVAEVEQFDINLLFPTENLSFVFGPNVLLPVICDYEEAKLNPEGITVRAFINDQEQTGLNLTHFTPEEYMTGRYTSDLNGTVPEQSGEHIIQIKAFRGGQEIAQSKSVKFTVKAFEGSFAPFVRWPVNPNDSNELIYQSMTDQSSLPLTVFGEDLDGNFEGVQFYVDGVPEGETFYRTEGLDQDKSMYMKMLQKNSLGIRSIFAIGHDSSGNYSPSPIRNLSITRGTEIDVSTEASLNGPIQQTLTDHDSTTNFNSAFNLTIDSNTGAITSVDLNVSRQYSDYSDFLNHLGLVEVDVLGTGSGAELSPVIDEKGEISAVQVISGGSGYSQSSTTLSLVPTVSIIGDGEPADLYIKDNPGQPPAIVFTERVDGTVNNGRGYSIAPKLHFNRGPETLIIQLMEYIPLQENGLSMSTLDQSLFPMTAPVTTTLDGENFRGNLVDRDRLNLIGGFTQSPLYYSLKTSLPDELLLEAKLVVNGTEIMSKSQAPYNFKWVPDVANYYSVYVLLRDIYGNIYSSDPGLVEIDTFKSGGMSATFLVDSDYTVESNGILMVSATATSEFGVDHVEFFVDDNPFTKVYRSGTSNTFSTTIDIAALGLAQGPHTLSIVGRDVMGNQAGSFSGAETNLVANKGTEFFVLPPQVYGAPEISLNYPTDNLSITSGSTILLASTASDPDNSVSSVQFYLNGMAYGEEIPINKTVPLQNQTFVKSWSPIGQTGKFYLSARATDVVGNQSFSEPAIVQVSPGSTGEYVPQVTLANLSSSYDVGDTIILSASANDSSDDATSAGSVESVSFYINGSLFGQADAQAPFVSRWIPNTAGLYQVHAQVRDNEGNINISTVQQVTIMDTENITLQVSPVTEVSVGAATGLLDGSRVNIIASATGDPEALEGLNNVALFINGQLVGRDTGEALLLETGLIDRILYSFEWLVDYERYADINGEVHFMIISNNPLYSSNTITSSIIFPEIGGAGSILKDLTGEGIDEDELEVYQTILSDNGGNVPASLKQWLDGFKSASIEQRLDIIAAQHVTLGRWPQSFTSLLQAENFVLPNNDQWLKNYIDELLLSQEYLSKFGQVPFLVGSFSKSNSINFFQNRLDFVNRCFLNKFGYLPSFSQSFQGSNRMLSYWGNFEPDYWELPIGRGDDGTIDSPPRRDALPVGTGVGQTGGGLVVDQNFNFNGPQSGHLAVDLIFHLARETPFEGGLPYIVGTPSYRENVYKIVMYAFFLMQENSSELTEADLSYLTSLPFDQAFDRILNDYRYTSRFNLIFKNSLEIGSDWKHEPWFGTFLDRYYPWIYHAKLGWLYVSGGTQNFDPVKSAGGFWMFSEKLGWFWSYNQVFPYIYFENEWIYLYLKSDSDFPYDYFSTAQNKWLKFQAH